MLSIFERATWILAAVGIVGIVVFFFAFGAPSTVPAIAVQVNTVSASEFTANLAPEAKKVFQDEKKENARKRPKVITHEVPSGTYERVSNINNAIREGWQAGHKIIENDDDTNYMQLTDVAEGSLFTKLGFQENDVLQKINGQNVDFTDKIGARTLFYELRAKFEAGMPIYVDLERNRKPFQLWFAPQ